jgi:alkanesulfonate monooxygenase
MPVQIIGMVGAREGSETKGSRSGAVDVDYITRFARAHEEAGFDRVLIGYGATGPDGWAIASHILHVTERLKVLIAHRPGFVQPTLVARKAATLDHLTGGGRVGIHFITGATEEDQHRDGDYVPHDTRYRRTGEYMQLVRRELEPLEPFDHEGEFYRVSGAFSTVKPATDEGILFHFGGASDPAVTVGAENADVYMMYAEPLVGIETRIAAVRAISDGIGRNPGFSLSSRPIVGATEEEAWARANDIADKTLARVGGGQWGSGRLGGQQGRGERIDVGGARLKAFADEKDVHDERLWTKITQISPSGNTSGHVGTAEQVAESLLRYYDLGVNNFLIRGFDPVEDVIDWGTSLVPAIRAGAEARDRVPAPA